MKISPTIQRATLENCAAASGVAVAIDVIRAYTTAAFGLAAGAQKILLTGTVEEALELRRQIPGALLMGEVGGRQPPGFDFGNSPSALAGLNLSGCTLIQRTSAGTQGPVRAVRASSLFGASFVVADATVRALKRLSPGVITLIATGVRPPGQGDEDVAQADYLEERWHGRQPDPATYLERVLRSQSAQAFLDPAIADFPAEDLDCCLDIDRFDFALRIERSSGKLILRKET